MIELTFEYWNKLAEQTIIISSLLGGFSIAVVANLLISDANSKIHRYILLSSTLASCFFLITVFAMTNLLLKTTAGYPMKVNEEDLALARIIGVMSLYFGMISLLSLDC